MSDVRAVVRGEIGQMYVDLSWKIYMANCAGRLITEKERSDFIDDYTNRVMGHLVAPELPPETPEPETPTPPAAVVPEPVAPKKASGTRSAMRK